MMHAIESKVAAVKHTFAVGLRYPVDVVEGACEWCGGHVDVATHETSPDACAVIRCDRFVAFVDEVQRAARVEVIGDGDKDGETWCVEATDADAARAVVAAILVDWPAITISVVARVDL